MSARHRNKKAKGRYQPNPDIEVEVPIEKETADPDAKTEFTEVPTSDIVPAVIVDEVVEPGATSFEELDEAKELSARKKTLDEIVEDAELITQNILFSDKLKDEQRPNAMEKLADAFRARVEKVVQPAEVKDFDFDVAELQMLANQVTMPLIDKVTNFISRKEGLEDVVGVRNAISMTVKKIEDGDNKARKKLPGLRAAAKKLGLGAPSQKNTNSLVVLKDKSGNYRWFGWVSNNFKDRDRQIITDEAHKEYVAWLDSNPQFAPTFRVWHTKGTDREKQADWWTYDHGFLMMSGPLTEKEAVALMRVEAKQKLGMSHGFYGSVQDEKYVTWYRSFEVSDLPSTKASNPWTPIGVIQKEQEMDKLKQEYIAEQLGPEFIEKVEAEAEAAQKELRNAGVEEKEVKDETVKAEEVEATELSEVMKEVAKQFGMPELSAWVKSAQEALAKVPQLEAQVAELAKSSDEKVAEAITPPAAKQYMAWMNRDSEKSENKVDDEKDAELLKDADPEGGWFAKVAGQPSLVSQ